MVAGSRTCAQGGQRFRRQSRHILDTHFLLWILLDLDRLDAYPWLDRYRPWGLSPISFLEISFLAKVGRLEADVPGLMERLADDPRFTVDEVPLEALIRHAVGMDWTRDPFDRLLAAHSAARRTPLCTLDRRMRAHHRFLVAELPAVQGTVRSNGLADLAGTWCEAEHAEFEATQKEFEAIDPELRK